MSVRDYIMLTDGIIEINELEWMRKEENMVEFKVLSHYLSGGSREKTRTKKENFKYHNNTIPKYKPETLKYEPACS